MLMGSFPNLKALYGIVCSKLSKTEQETELQREDFLQIENVLIYHEYAFFLVLSSRRGSVKSELLCWFFFLWEKKGSDVHIYISVSIPISYFGQIMQNWKFLSTA